MKVAIDGQLFLKGNKTGIAWCAHNVLINLPQENIEYMINYFSLGFNEETIEQVSHYNKYGYGLCRNKFMKDSIYKILCSIFPIPYSLFFPQKVNATLFFNYIVPSGVRGKKAVVVHDMAYKDYPETVRARTRKYLTLCLKKSCQRADVIITISEFSKSRIMELLDIEEKKIKVIPLGVDYDIYNTCATKNERDYLRRKYGFTKDYYLYLGTIEPRKNIERMIRAYAQLVEEKENVPLLVLAGQKGWLYESIYESVKELNLETKVMFLGYVDITDLPKLLRQSFAFVFPSLYEGFGLPPLEAMACGTPVIVSKEASLPEVVGKAGLYVDPLNITDIKDAMKKMLDQPNLRNSLIEEGFQQISKFSWKTTANKFETILRNM